MVLRNLIAKTAPIARHLSTTSVRQCHHNTRGIIGSNLPFQIENRYRFTFVFMVYCATGFGLPFFILRHALLTHK